MNPISEALNHPGTPASLPAVTAPASRWDTPSDNQCRQDAGAPRGGLARWAGKVVTRNWRIVGSLAAAAILLTSPSNSSGAHPLDPLTQNEFRNVRKIL